jgi:DNA-directed RNA polymerase specialized sigma24 family protein
MCEKQVQSTDDCDDQLSDIETCWAEMERAHEGQGEARLAAQKHLLLRYHGAAYRYLLGIVRDPQVAGELTQEFAVRFLRGDFRRADPAQGRFRDLLKTALRHLAQDFWRRQKKALPRLAEDLSEQARSADMPGASLDRQFLSSWRDEILARTWEALATLESKTGQPYLTALLGKTVQPQLRSAQLAEELRTQLGRSFTEPAVRQLLHRARTLFAHMLVQEVARSLETEELHQIEEELIDLDLFPYCKSALERRKQGS